MIYNIYKVYEHKKIPLTTDCREGNQDGDYLLSHLRSTIGVTKLNFSVRNGKRWNLRAIVTWISFGTGYTEHESQAKRTVKSPNVYATLPEKGKWTGN